jgi:hypothetical protein
MPTTRREPPHYALARHVFVCVRDEDLVLLDLKRDKYLALEAIHAACLAPLVPGWPVGAPVVDATRSSAAEEPRALARELLLSGLLIEDCGRGKEATPAASTPATAEITADDHFEGLRVRPGELIAFLTAATTSALLLRHRPVERVVNRIWRRKALAATHSRSGEAAGVRRLVGVFNRLRPLFLSTRNACLFETLALLEFLSRYDFFPTWVFGVQTRPFAAHCWVQAENLVLNDTVDHVGRYTPIMTA